MIEMAHGFADEKIKKKSIDNALEDAVSLMDGFGRELCRVNAHKASDPAKAEKISFQRFLVAEDKIKALFNIDIRLAVNSSEREKVIELFQKRHLIVHKMGVIDQDYIDKTGADIGLLGRKVILAPNELPLLTDYLLKIAGFLVHELNKIP